MSALFDRDDIERAQTKPLPKPSRVEKWQRWRRRETVITIGDEVPGGGWWNVGGGQEVSAAILSNDTWQFLGHTKPSKVDIGQRWRMRDKSYRVLDVRDNGMSTLERTDIPGTLVSRSGLGIIESTDWQYLGMSDAQSPAESLATKLNARNDGLDYTPSGPNTITATPFRVGSSVARPEPVKPPESNEQVAKRLIADPPQWAYPNAWMCAVLAAHECYPYMMHDTDWIAPLCKLAHERKPHDSIAGSRNERIHSAYSRAMDHKPWSVATKPVNQKFRRVR